jgi:hypothetical protein
VIIAPRRSVTANPAPAIQSVIKGGDAGKGILRYPIFHFRSLDPNIQCSYNDILADNIFDFIEYLDQGNENENGVPQNPFIGIATFYD